MIEASPAHELQGVILLHGLARTPGSLKKIEKCLASHGFLVANLGYPSRTAPVRQLSRLAIEPALAHLRGRHCARVHFVTHSLGGILVRDFLSIKHLPDLGRVVMLGPPNQGSEVVDRLRTWKVFQWLNGPAGQELGTDTQSVPNSLPPVSFELGVIAGDRSINWINSCMIPGRDDGKVSVERTKVAGMKAHLVLHVTHPMMMKNAAVIGACVRFLKTGKF